MNRERERNVQQACAEWGPVLKRLAKERGIQEVSSTLDEQSFVARTR
jgi:hypothetical protein